MSENFLPQGLPVCDLSPGKISVTVDTGMNVIVAVRVDGVPVIDNEFPKYAILTELLRNVDK